MLGYWLGMGGAVATVKLPTSNSNPGTWIPVPQTGYVPPGWSWCGLSYAVGPDSPGRAGDLSNSIRRHLTPIPLFSIPILETYRVFEFILSYAAAGSDAATG